MRIACFLIFALPWLAGCQAGRPAEAARAPTVVSLDVHPYEAADTHEADELAIATWNVHWQDQPADLARTIGRMGAVDVWCLQEVRIDARADAEAVIDAVDDLLPPGRWHVAAIPLNRLRERASDDWESQVIASRFPLTDVTVANTEDRPGAKRRVMLSAAIQVGAQPIRIVNVDHEPSYFSFTDHSRRQSLAAATALSLADGVPTVVADDFNTAGNLWRLRGNENTVASLDALMSQTSFRPAMATTDTFRRGWASLCLDRIYTSGVTVTRAGVQKSAVASNHRPVWCMIDLSGPEMRSVGRLNVAR